MTTAHSIIIGALKLLRTGLILPPVDEEDEWSVDQHGIGLGPDAFPEYDFTRALAGPLLDERELVVWWADFMLRNTPNGYEVFAVDRSLASVGENWEWGRGGEAVDADVPRGLTRGEARHAAWLDCIKRQHPTLDLTLAERGHSFDLVASAAPLHRPEPDTEDGLPDRRLSSQWLR